MSLSLPYDVTASGGISPYQVQADLITLANKFGSIQPADLASGFVLPTAQLSASNVEEVQTVFLAGQTFNVLGDLDGPFNVPGTSGSYTIKSIIIASRVTGTTGTAAPQINIQYGTISGGAFTSSGALFNNTSLGGFTSSGYYQVTATPAVTTLTGGTALLARCGVVQAGSQSYFTRITITYTRSLQ